MSSETKGSKLGAILTEGILKKTAERLTGTEYDPGYSFDSEKADLKKLSTSSRNLALQQFDWGLATYLRACDNGALPELEQWIAEELDKRKNANRSMLHALFYVAGVSGRSTVSMWAKAAEFVLEEIESTADIQTVTKRFGGIRKCAERTRGHDSDEGDSESDDDSPAPVSPGPRNGGGGHTKAGATLGDFGLDAFTDGDGPRPSTKGNKPRAVRAKKNDSDDDPDGGAYIHVEFSDEAHGAFKAVLASKEIAAVAQITYYDSLAVYADTVSCNTCPLGKKAMTEHDDFED